MQTLRQTLEQKPGGGTADEFKHGYSAGILSATKANTSKPPLRRLDPLYSQLSHLGLVTMHLKQTYWVNRHQALMNLLQELTLIQKLYEGSPLDIEQGHESLQTRAMELNIHLINTAGFGDYSNAEKVNIIYQLRRAVEMMCKQHFTQDRHNAGIGYKFGV